MNEKIIQIIPAPSNLMYAYDGGTAQPVALLWWSWPTATAKSEQ
jgi:hypothetical protein